MEGRPFEDSPLDRRNVRYPRTPTAATPGDQDAVRCGRVPFEEWVLVGHDSPVGEEVASGLENAGWVLLDYERRRLVVQVRIHSYEPGPNRLS